MEILKLTACLNGASNFQACGLWLVAQIHDFRRNPGFSPKSKIFTEIPDFRQNPRFSPKSQIFAKILDFRRNPRFSPKSEIFDEIQDFRQNPIRFRPARQIFSSVAGRSGGAKPPQPKRGGPPPPQPNLGGSGEALPPQLVLSSSNLTY